MKRITILVLLSLCVLSARAQNRFRAAVIEPAAPTAETGLVRHPWTGKKVLFIGDSISDCVASHIVDRHYYDWLSDWLGITAYVPAISGWQMKDVEAEVRMFQATAPGVQPDMICIFLGTNDYNSGISIGEWYTEAVEEVQAANVWSVNVIDLHAVSGMYPILDEDAALFYKNMDKDRLHPNEAGHRRLAEVLLYQSLVLPCRVI